MFAPRLPWLAAACLVVAALAGVAATAPSSVRPLPRARLLDGAASPVARRDAAPPRRGRRGARRRRLPRARRPAAGAPRRALEPAPRRYDPGPERPRARSTPTCCSCTPPRRGSGIAGRRATTHGRAPPRASSPARRSGAQGRARPGWRASPDVGDLHPVFEAEVAEGLAAAYRARRRARARRGDGRARSRASSRACSRARPGAGRRCGSTSSTGTRRSFAADATVNGARPRARRRACGATSTASPRRDGAAGNFGPGLRFHYDPRWRARALELRLGRVREHRARLLARLRAGACARGCAAPAGVGLLREWVRRALGGLLDARGLPELGHRPRLPALAPAQEGRPRARRADRDRRRARAAAQPALGRVGEVDARPRAARLRSRSPTATTASRPRWPTACTACPSRSGWRCLTAARYAANAMRALDAGLGRRPRASRRRCTPSTPTPAGSRSPPPRTTPRSSPSTTARIPYGGLDLARLFDGHQEVAANIGGTGSDAFGLQRGLAAHAVRRRAARRSPLELVRAPRGVGAEGRSARVRGPVHGPARARRPSPRGGLRARRGVPLHAGGDRGPLERLRAPAGARR